MIALLAGLACTPANLEVGGKSDRGPASGEPDTGEPADTAITDDTDDSGPALECDDLPVINESPSLRRGFTSAEDFAFNGLGEHVSLDGAGNLLGITYDGNKRVIYPGLGTAAGTHMLADGRVVFADVLNNSIVAVDTENQVVSVLAAGLAYPNGLDVGDDNAVYVAETGGGSLKRIDVETGEATLLASGLTGPNGVSFGPNFDSLYVGSFGAGAVWRLDRDGAGVWSRARVWAVTPGSAGVPDDVCLTEPLGTPCATAGTYGIGTCQDAPGGAMCALDPDEEACLGLANGDACTTLSFDGNELLSSCLANSADELYCPRARAELVDACRGVEAYAECNAGDGPSVCYPSFEGALLCYPPVGANPRKACEDKADGDDCVVADPVFPFLGSCTPQGDALSCAPPAVGGGAHAMLDGLNVDACGYVYATSYVEGTVWRWREEDGDPELVVDVSASWIPNLHWGNGVGGWNTHTLYMANRDIGGVYELEVGVPGHDEAFQP